MIVVVAANRQHFDYYCRFVAEPPLNPRDWWEVFCLSSVQDTQRFRGRRKQPKDSVVYYTWPRDTDACFAIDYGIRIWSI